MHLSESERLTLAHWQRGDELLYKAFSSIFQKRIEDYGVQRMKQVKFSSPSSISIDHLIYNHFYTVLYLPCLSLIIQIGCAKTAST